LASASGDQSFLLCSTPPFELSLSLQNDSVAFVLLSVDEFHRAILRGMNRSPTSVVIGHSLNDVIRLANVQRTI